MQQGTQAKDSLCMADSKFVGANRTPHRRYTFNQESQPLVLHQIDHMNGRKYRRHIQSFDTYIKE
jgi:hypothetical protein